MAELSDLSLRDRLWFRRYDFRRVEPLPSATLDGPVAEARVGIVTTAGLHLPGDPPFRKEKGGDVSFRVIPADADLGALECSHPSSAWNRGGVEEDPNVVLPLERLRELAAAGEIGGPAPRHVSFQGSITAPGRLVSETAPEAAELLVADQVDLALLTPV